MRTTGVLLCDITFAAAGTLLLWWNGGTTVVDGPWYGFALFLLIGIIVLVLRQLAAAQRPIERPHDPTSDKIVTLLEAVLLAGVTAAWLVLNDYFLGWAATFSALCFLVAATLQLLTDVLTARNSGIRKTDTTRVVRRKLRSLEVHRLLMAILAVVAVVVTAPIHHWMPSLLNPLLLLIVAPLILTVAVSLFAPSRTRRLTQGQ
ncbi:hypothetical protein [Microbacterium hydrocarbonoxydans]|uniref:hypothetical protein n=1 Tax=Microbacterium hydrocarbonoxydans TaxID=273678 RepID=UPI00203C6B9E|nr:hypothetical protein [Microbacterium hydrocarbonoxydans]MCM3781271.1 hypothetical protein [Microbacterium hydrocarbonoxydans]